VLILFPKHFRPAGFRQVIKCFLELAFDEAAFFFNHQYFFETGCEIDCSRGFKRPWHANLVNTQSGFGGERFIYAQVREGLADGKVGFAAGDDAEAHIPGLYVLGTPDNLVHRVCLCEGQCGG